MRKGTVKKWMVSAWLSVFMAIEVLFLTDTMVVWLGKVLPLSAAVIFLSVLSVAIFLLFGRHRKALAAVVILMPVILSVVTISGYMFWSRFSEKSGYRCADNGKGALYQNHRVMLIVPHQDDDLNILGGVMEEYVRYGSELVAVFVTNGDYFGLTQTRYQEAVQVFESMGVPEENVIFLGYGDNWKEGGPHLYNAEPGEIMESYYGSRETYGTQEHPAYREGRTYTIDHLTEDLQSVILEYRPDVIFCSDYDHHIDHKATSLVFEKVMGNLLKENPEYTPAVYKAYAYGTAWEADPDFYAENILSTQNLFLEPYGQEPGVYRWEDRIRFPVNGAGLSRSLVAAEGYAQLKMYESQDASLKAAAVINGDRVAWQRYTDSLVLHGMVTASSGDVSYLNDFMLTDNFDLVDIAHKPYDGVWVPAAGDSQKTITVTLKEPADISSILLYDHPSEEDNILNAVIAFDDGTNLQTGPLHPGGAATVVAVEKSTVSSFTVTLEKTEGMLAGLSELEAYDHELLKQGAYLKLMDAEENFLYDFRTSPDGEAELLVYLHGQMPELTTENYAVALEGEAGSAALENGMVRVHCPSGSEFMLTVSCRENDVSDSIYVRNPGKMERLWNDLWQQVEEAVFTRYSRSDQKKLLTYRVWERVSEMIRYLE